MARPSIASTGTGPFNLILDKIWIPSDPARQALRDKFSHAYVVKRRARPAGTGQVVYTTCFMLGNAFLFREVRAQELVGGALGASLR